MWTRKDNIWLFKKDNVNIWDKFWLLTIIKETEPRWVSKSRPNWYRYFTCKCECGAVLDCNYSRIKTWRAKSCWCNAAKLASERMKWNTIWVWRTHTQSTKEKMRRWNPEFRELKQSIRECEWLWDISNWITLNKVIHNKFHAEYWFWNNTPEEFYKFKEQLCQ